MKDLLCGAAKAIITPKQEWVTHLQCMNMTFGGILDDILVRTIAIGNGESTMLFVGYDLDMEPYPEESIVWITSHTNVPEENIFLFGTHTHAVPRLGPRKYEPRFHHQNLTEEDLSILQAYESYVLESMHSTVLQAIESMRPARFGVGRAPCYITSNRTETFTWTDSEGNPRESTQIGFNPEGPVDHTVFTMKFEDLEGNMIACLVNYAVHCAALFPNELANGKLAVTSDIGGNVSHLIEAKTPDCVAIWSAAPSGDVNPIMMNAFTYRNPVDGSPVQAELHGDTRHILNFSVARHYAVVEELLNTISCDRDRADISGAMALVELPLKKAERTKTGWIVSSEPSETPYQIRLHYVSFGDLAFCGVGGELFTRHGWIMQEALPIDLVIITHDHEQSHNAGYIGDDDGLRLHAHGTKGGLAPGLVGPALKESLQKMYLSCINVP